MPIVFTLSSHSEKNNVLFTAAILSEISSWSSLFQCVHTLHNYMTDNTEEVHAPESMLSTLDSHKEKQPNLHNLVLAGAKDRGDQFILTHRYLVHNKKIYWVDAKAASCFLCLSTHSQVSYTK